MDGHHNVTYIIFETENDEDSYSLTIWFENEINEEN